MKRQTLAATLVVALSLGITSAAVASSGAGAINLTFPIGARYNALGEAGTALAQDATAQYWNPGGLRASDWRIGQTRALGTLCCAANGARVTHRICQTVRYQA